jgi:hypothetical protein
MKQELLICPSFGTSEFIPVFFCGLGVSQSLEFLTRVLQQTVNISLSTKCAHLLANLFFIRKENSYTDVFTFR